MQQFYKIDRDIMDRWFGKDNERIIWWLDCQVMATHADTDSLRAGQFEASLSFLCSRWNAGRKRIENFIAWLLENGKINRTATRQTTIYTIAEGTNQGTYQGTNQGTNEGTYQGANENAEISDTYGGEGTNEGTNGGTYQGANQGTNEGTIITRYTRLLDNISTTTTPAGARACEGDDGSNGQNGRDGIDWMREFNGMMDEAGAAIPRIKTLTGKRRTALNARIHDFGADAVMEVIGKAARSPFLNGRGSSIFVAGFDWLMRPNNFPKVLEGNYDEMFNQQQNNNGYGFKDNRGYNPSDDAAARREQDARALIGRLLAENERRPADGI